MSSEQKSDLTGGMTSEEMRQVVEQIDKENKEINRVLGWLKAAIGPGNPWTSPDSIDRKIRAAVKAGELGREDRTRIARCYMLEDNDDYTKVRVDPERLED